MLQENVNKMEPLTQRFHLHQCSQYSTHVQGNILDLVFDSKNRKVCYGFPRHIVTILYFGLTFNDLLNGQNVLQFQRD